MTAPRPVFRAGAVFSAFLLTNVILCAMFRLTNVSNALAPACAPERREETDMGKTGLSDGEWRIMNLLWERSPRRVPELTEALAGDTGWSRATVNIMLTRLEEKGAVRMEARGRSKVYYPLFSQADARRKETARFLDRLYGGSLGLMVSSFAGQQALSKEDVKALRALLDEAENKEN